MPKFARTSLLLMLCLGLFWSSIFVSESLSRPMNMSPEHYVDLHITRDGSLNSILETHRLKLRGNPLYYLRDSAAVDSDEDRIGVFEIPFEVADTQNPIALFVGMTFRIDEVQINGHTVKSQTARDVWGQTTGFSPGVYVIPGDFLSLGKNFATVHVGGHLSKRLPVFHFGPAGDAIRAQTWARVFTFDLVTVSIGIMLFVVLLIYLVNWPTADRNWVNAHVVLLVIWILRDLIMLGFDSWLYPEVSWVVYLIIALMLPAAFLDFIIARTGVCYNYRKYRFWLFSFCLLIPVIIVLANVQYIGAYDSGWYLEIGVTILLMLVIVAILSYAIHTSKDRSTFELLLYLFCAFALLFDAVDDLFHLTVPFTTDLYLTFYFAPLCGSVLGLGMCASIAAQASRARHTVLEMNLELEERLAEREQQIRIQARDRALVDERKRIMRDMHDGIGAMLSGIVLQTRSNQLPYDEVPQAVQNGLDELRLVIDSLDSAGDTLAVALGAFRERAEGYLNAAGIDLSWDMDPGIANIELPANDVLQLYRILQEATSNIVKHSKARLASYQFGIDNQVKPPALVVSVFDDGIGFEGENLHGKGISSMTARAERIGSTLELKSSSQGTELKLLFHSK